MDCTFTADNGIFNYRVGAIISDGKRMLMATNPNSKEPFYYSVGGRVKFGETLKNAVLRELKEETGIKCEIDRMVCIHENFFNNESGIPFHEISVYFLIKPDKELLGIKNGYKTHDGPDGEYLEWIDLDNSNDKIIYPEFYKTVDFYSEKEVKHFVTFDLN